MTPGIPCSVAVHVSNLRGTPTFMEKNSPMRCTLHVLSIGSADECNHLCDITLGAVKSRLHRARCMLSDSLQPDAAGPCRGLGLLTLCLKRQREVQ